MRKPVGVPVCGLTRRSRSTPNPRSPADRACRRSPRPSPAAGADHRLSQPRLATRVRLYLTIGGRQQALDCLVVSARRSRSLSAVPSRLVGGPLCANGIFIRHSYIGERVCALGRPQSNRRSAVGCASSRLRHRHRPALLRARRETTAFFGCLCGPLDTL